MPDAYTHLTFAKQLINKLPDNYQTLVTNHFETFLLGASGPDPFYYYGLLIPRKKRSFVVESANLLHHDKLDTFFDYVVEQLMTTKHDALKSYLLGYLSHYFLDKTCHPFIFYRSGFSDDIQAKHFYSSMHKLYEVGVDAAILAYYESKTFKQTHIYPYLKVKHADMECIYQYYEQMFTKIYNHQLSIKQIKQSFKDMYSVFKLFEKHPNILHSLSKIVNQKLAIIIKSAIPIYTLDYDYLNLKQLEWHDPCTNVASQLSFIDLMQLAQKGVLSVYTKLDELQKKQIGKQVVLEAIGTTTFDTNLDITYQKKYHDAYIKYSQK